MSIAKRRSKRTNPRHRSAASKRYRLAMLAEEKRVPWKKSARTWISEAPKTGVVAHRAALRRDAWERARRHNYVLGPEDYRKSQIDAAKFDIWQNKFRHGRR